MDYIAFCEKNKLAFFYKMIFIIELGVDGQSYYEPGQIWKEAAVIINFGSFASIYT